jgi:hypothetical protein
MFLQQLEGLLDCFAVAQTAPPPPAYFPGRKLLLKIAPFEVSEYLSSAISAAVEHCSVETSGMAFEKFSPSQSCQN